MLDELALWAFSFSLWYVMMASATEFFLLEDAWDISLRNSMKPMYNWKMARAQVCNKANIISPLYYIKQK